jgi:hypothetical protein
MKSWRTTLGGVVAAIGSVLTVAVGVPHWVHLAGATLNAIGIALLGATARDNEVTSKQAGLE